ncbi:Gfo/Idh/MocA family oxidoreductase [Candidatus Poribacteria bacterium]|nr:Gfo/Idh/MocA family oxidoreductase [Candidatus Poribacteria bacterium]
MKIRMAQYSIAHAHASGKADAMKRNPDVEFCGVFEPDPKIQALYGKDMPWFKSKDEMLEDPSIIAIAVEGKVCQNLAFARECIEHGKHIWLDKPAGNDLEEFRKILDMAREKGLLVQMGYMFRYNLGFQFLFDRIKDGSLGDIFSVRGRMSTGIPPERRPELGKYQGGILFELLCHLIDIVVFLLGRPDKVTTFLRNDLGITPEFSDNALAVFEYKKAIASLESAAMEVSPFPARRFEVYGTKGSVIIEPLEPPSVRLCLMENQGKYVKGWQTVDAGNPGGRYDGELVAFVADIKKEKLPDRILEHEFIVQETVLRASRVI